MSIYRNFKRVDRVCRRRFMINMIWRGWRGFAKFRKRIRKGFLFPAFQFISVTNDCNLRCQGCWVSSNGHKEYMPVEKIQSVIDAGKRQGSFFFGILGGEPLMHKQLLSVFKSNPDCYFQLFTNGTLFDQSIASQLRKAGNVTPLFSFEGDEQVADIRRGGRHVYNRTLQAIRHATEEKLLTGVAISVCKSNIEMALSEEFVMMLHDMGVLYLWYYIYRPVGSQPNYELSLSSEEILCLRKFLVEGRGKYPIVLIDSYWKANGEPFCPAADGLSHHINPSGFIEPCPVIQFTRDTISGEKPETIYEKSELLKQFRKAIHAKTQGCVLMEDPAWLAKFACEIDAQNSSNRDNYTESLLSAPEKPSHGSCEVIPEKNILYRIAKKNSLLRRRCLWMKVNT